MANYLFITKDCIFVSRFCAATRNMQPAYNTLSSSSSSRRMSRSLTECGFSQFSLPWHVNSTVQHKLFWLHEQLFVQRILLVHEQMRPSRSSDAIGQEHVFHFFFPTHAPVGTQCMAWSHVKTSTPSFVTEPALQVPQNLLRHRPVFLVDQLYS